MLRFDPPENSIFAEKQPSEGHVSVGWQMFDAWRGERGYREIARDLGCSPGVLSTWKQGRVPVKVYLEKLEKMADIAPIAWQYWVCLDPTKAAATSDEPPASNPPASESRKIQGKIGATIDELRVGVARLNDLLGRGKLSPGQIAQLEGKRISALTAIARLEERGGLEEHPEFDAFVDLALTAFERTIREHYGLDPAGARTAFASYLEQIENERSAKKNAA
jgi:transcriptional regulator with XRE-family HTH domain